MRKLAIFTAGFALISAIFVYLLSDLRVLWIVAFSIPLCVVLRKVGISRIAILFLGVAIGGLWCLCYWQFVCSDIRDLDGQTKNVEVYITDTPYKTKNSVVVSCELEGYNAVLYAEEDLLKVRSGDTVAAVAEILVDENDGSIRLFVHEEVTVKSSDPNLFMRIRGWIEDRIETLYKGQTAGLMKALLTGNTNELTFETSNEMSVVGIRHAVAVSGLHVSILLAMITLLCARQPRLTAILGIPVIVIFVFVTGAAPSACRAAIMQIVLLSVPLFHKESDSLTSLALAGLILLCIDPWIIADIGAQLSFSAVFGLIIMSEPIQDRILKLCKKQGALQKFVASGVAASLSATLATMPLSLLYFEMISIVAPLSNLLTLWAITGILTLGLISCILGNLGVIIAWIVKLLAGYVFGFCDVMSAFPFSAAYIQNIPLLCWAVLGYFLIAAVFLSKKLPIRWVICSVLVSFVICISAAYIRFMAPAWRITVLDVGQGQCLVLRMDDYIAVIDCGGDYTNTSGEQAARYFHSAGITHIDALIITHYDTDHAGGAVQFLSRVRTDMVYLPPADENDALAEEIISKANEYHVVEDNVNICVDNNKICIFPPVSEENSNNRGITILATAQEYDMLITGDLNDKAEKLLVDREELPQVELLVAGHHGAKTSTSEELLTAIDPGIAVISVGKGNRYGHPHEETLQRLENRGIRIYRTDLDGTIEITP